ncbi:MAG: redox-regulated ATPase YchF [Myxococcales bacterium]|nr:redox-regulated ATPase YchF [Myxococcales bacterium]
MALSIGIVGLPNVGKTTLFNALCAASAAASNYPFCTIEPNLGMVPVPDERLSRLAKVVKSEKVTPTTLEFVDIAGLVRGASKGEGLGNQFLANIREVSAVAQVLRCFESENVSHVEGGVDPIRDKEVVDTELCLKDLETVEKRREKVSREAKAPGKEGEEARKLLGLLDRLGEALNSGRPVRAMGLPPEEAAQLSDLFLLTAKPVLYVANVGEGQLDRLEEDPLWLRVLEMAKSEGAEAVALAAELEAEIQQLPEEDRPAFLESAGLSEPGLNKVVEASYRLLGLITFFTFNPKELRAWTVKKGCRAPQAAGVIHTDFERGFIKAEVMRWEDLAKLGSEAAVRERGLLRLEGKEYLVQDGDCILFKFAV